MDQFYNPDFKPLVETAERFAEREILGKVVKLDSLEKPGFPWDAIRAGGEAGFLCGPLSEEVGGGSLGIEALAVLIEKLAEGAAGPAMIFAAHLAVTATLAGFEALKPMLSKMAEHAADSQPFLFGVALPKTAVSLDRPAIPLVEEKKGDLVIAGDFVCFPAPTSCRQVMLVTGEKDAQAALVDSDRFKALSEATYPGSGLEEFSATGLKLDNFKVSDDEVLDKSACQPLWRHLRILTASAQLGNARAAARQAWEYAGERIQTGRKIIEHQDVRRTLENMAELLSAMLGMARLAASAPTGNAAVALARHAYTFCGTAAEQVCLDAIQTLGGYGYMKDYGLEKRARDAKSLQCLLGTYIEDILGET